MADETFKYRFPRSNKVFDNFEASKKSDWLTVAGYALLYIGALAVDFPGAVVKTGQTLRERLKKPSTSPLPPR